MEEIDKEIADFPITINLLFRNFSKQASTLVALRYEEGNCSPRFGKIQKRSGKTA